MTPASLHAQLRTAYIRSGLSQAQIAARAESSENTVKRALDGRNVRTHSLVAIAAALGLHVSLTHENTTPR